MLNDFFAAALKEAEHYRFKCTGTVIRNGNFLELVMTCWLFIIYVWLFLINITSSTWICL